MTRFIWITMITLLFVGCSKTTVVLLDSGKTQNAVLVSTDKGSSELDKVGSFVDLKDKDKAPTETKIMSKDEIEKRFSKVLAVSPDKAKTFILYFHQGSTELTQESETVLEDALKAIVKNSPSMVDVIGHTDTVGSNEWNIQISLKRAKYIESIIKNRAIKLLSLTAKGYGEEDLLVETSDDTAEARNRNVEIFIK